MRTRFIPDWKGIMMFLRDPRADWKPKVLAGLAVIYFVWPLDLLPDLVPLIGWLDDIGFSVVAAWYLLRTTKRYLETRERK